MLTNPLRRRLAPPHRLIDQVGINHDDVVVDFGCGPGYFTVEIGRRARKTIGVDISLEMLEKARKTATKAGVTVDFIQSNGERVELPSNSVDLILLVHVYHEIADKEKALLEFRRILREGGRVVIQERTGKKGLSRFLPGPPIFDLRKITELGVKVGFALDRVEPYGGGSYASLVTLKKA